LTRPARSFTAIFVTLIAGAIAVVWFVRPWRLLTMRGYQTHGNSMAPTAEDGDHFMADLLAYRSKSPQRGDVIVGQQGTPQYGEVLKRVIAVGGDEIRGDEQGIWLNGKLLNEPYVFKGDDGKPVLGPPFDAVRVPADCVFIMGDNRDSSFDRRRYGSIAVSRVFGRALYIYWSHDHSRIGREIR
jgi:signal peptidase I